MTGAALPPAATTTRPEGLTVAMAVLLVAVGNFGSAVLAALLVLICLAGCAPSADMMIGPGGNAEITADRGDAPSSTDRSDRSDRGGRSSTASASQDGGAGSASGSSGQSGPAGPDRPPATAPGEKAGHPRAGRRAPALTLDLGPVHPTPARALRTGARANRPPRMPTVTRSTAFRTPTASG
jgi:hypothetical protein